MILFSHDFDLLRKLKSFVQEDSKRNSEKICLSQLSSLAVLLPIYLTWVLILEYAILQLMTSASATPHIVLLRYSQKLLSSALPCDLKSNLKWYYQSTFAYISSYVLVWQHSLWSNTSDSCQSLTYMCIYIYVCVWSKMAMQIRFLTSCSAFLQNHGCVN